MTREQVLLRSAVSNLTVHARRIIEGLRAGGHVSTRAGSSVEFDRYRGYQPGDDIRHLDWRVFARSERLVLKRARLETTLDVLLVIDASGSMAFDSGGSWGSKFDLAAAIAQALAWLAVESGDRVSACRCTETDTKMCPLAIRWCWFGAGRRAAGHTGGKWIETETRRCLGSRCLGHTTAGSDCSVVGPSRST